MLISMLLPAKNGKNRNEKRMLRCNIFNASELQASLIFGVFATNCIVGGLHANYERHFVNKIQRQSSLQPMCPRFYIRCLMGGFRGKWFILQ